MSQLGPINNYLLQLLRNSQLKYLLPYCSKQMHVLASNDKRKFVPNHGRNSNLQFQCYRWLSLSSKKYQQQSDQNKDRKPQDDEEKKRRIMIGALFSATLISVVGSTQVYAKDREKKTNKDFVFGKNREENPDLPSTVTVLDYPASDKARKKELNDRLSTLRDRLFGAKVYLVGTAHFSEESQKDVQQTITATQPDLVMLELCPARSKMLTLDEETLLKEASTMSYDKIMENIKKSGFGQAILHLLLVSIMANFTKQMGMAPGGEFRAAYKQAKTVPGCRIVLGDRPINVTLSRAFAALTFWQKLRFLCAIIMSHSITISKEVVEGFKRNDMLEELAREFGAEFPALSHILVSERDQFMSHILLSLAVATTRAKSAAVTEHDSWEPAVIVAVVGIGHVTGIVSNWGNRAVDMKELMRIPGKSK